METQNANTKRIAKNTLMLYVRLTFSLLASLYTSRVVLNALGVENYGIYNVVGGFVGTFSLVSSALSSSVSRFITFELGKGNQEKLNRVFSTAVLIHLVLSAIILILMETMGVWFLNNKMTIPLERLYAANMVFQASIVTFLLGLISVPYNATIVAHEKMDAFAYIGILDVSLKLTVVLFIANASFDFDRLIIYSFLLVAAGVLVQITYLLYCRNKFDECRLRFCFDKLTWKEMSAFAGWNFIGCAAGILKSQGVNILLNIFSGPVLNAARGISVSVNTAVCAFAGNVTAAMNPQIIKTYASGETGYMMSLVERGSRFSFYVIFMLGLPILFETDFVLTLWLKQYPEHTVNFVRLILLLSMSDILSQTLITLQLATGKIRNYQLVVGGMLLMNFPLSYFCLKAGLPPESVYIVALLVSVSCMFLRLVFLRKMAGLPFWGFIKNVYANILLVALCSIVLPAVVYWQMQEGWVRFIAVSVVCLICTSFSVCFVGCTTSERNFIFTNIKNRISR